MLQISRFLVTTVLCLLGLIITQTTQAQDQSNLDLITESVVEYRDFPKQGVDFYDVSGVLKNPTAFRALIDNLTEHYRNQKIEAILAIDSRGFLFATPLAYNLKIPVIMLRKPGKLPGKTLSSEYTKEYGKDTLEIQASALAPKQRVLIIDDLVATGGTLRAAIKLARMAQATVVEVASIIELTEFRDSRGLDVPVYSVVKK